MNTTAATATGTEFAATVARYFHIGPRTRRYRNGMDMHQEIAEAVQLAATVPGYFTEHTEQSLRAAFAAVCGYHKHIGGYRLNGEVIAKVNAMSPYQFAKMLGSMIAADVANAYEAEKFFKAMGA